MRPLDVLRSWAVQDSPPGAAISAVVARVPDTPVDWLDEAPVVALYNPRTATAVVPADEVAVFGTAFLPPDDQALKAIVDTALPTYDEGFAEPVRLAVDAISDALDGLQRSRDDLQDQLHGWDAPERTAAGAELVRRYRATYGPSSASHFATWAGLGKAHARELWELDDASPTPMPLDGVRLLAPGDPVLLGRDRETLM